MTYEYDIGDYLDVLEEVIDRHQELLRILPDDDAEAIAQCEYEIEALKELFQRIELQSKVTKVLIH